MKCKVASKVIAASMAVAMVITMAGCGSSGKRLKQEIQFISANEGW